MIIHNSIFHKVIYSNSHIFLKNTVYSIWESKSIYLWNSYS